MATYSFALSQVGGQPFLQETRKVYGQACENMSIHKTITPAQAVKKLGGFCHAVYRTGGSWLVLLGALQFLKQDARAFRAEV